jgi:DnaJ-domain-containing protein 1
MILPGRESLMCHAGRSIERGYKRDMQRSREKLWSTTRRKGTIAHSMAQGERMSKQFNPFARLSQKITKEMQAEMQQQISALLKDAASPEKIEQLLKRMGIDSSQLGQILGQKVQAGAMPPGFDPYRVLGLDKSASDEDVKKRYREMVKRLHPDSAGVKGTDFLLQIVMVSYEMIKRERGWQ